MVRLKSKEIIKVLEALIGEVEAVGESNEDERRFENLMTLIFVSNWCTQKLVSSMKSGRGRPEQSMQKISDKARGALFQYKTWANNFLGE